MNQEELRSLAMELPEDILKAKWCGDFERAERMIDLYLQNDRTPDCVKTRLEAERKVIRRLPGDYAYTRAQALAIVQKDIPDFTMEELESFIDMGKIDWIYIQGELHTATRFYETLVKVQPDIARRAGLIREDFNETDTTRHREECLAIMEDKGEIRAHIHLRARLELDEEAFKQEEILVHLPVPKPQKNMQNIRILKTFPENGQDGAQVIIGGEEQRARTVSFRQMMTENHPFWVEYEYDSVMPLTDTTKAPREQKRSEEAKAAAAAETYRQEDLMEVYPHIRFTDTVRALCAEIKGEETDPLKVARRFYDYVTTKIVYSFMRGYYTLEEIPEYAMMGQKGDCGVQALTFITLCRCAGIPARWQSGLEVSPDYGQTKGEAGMHDWAMFYVEGYGWLFADCSYGGSAYRSGNLKLWNHYFGNLEEGRMAANDAYQADLIPPKQYGRWDPYDNQAGEAEYTSGGLRGDQMDRTREILEYRYF
ncbi:MAG: transglutaminase domain-containing protein [Lachnospiraceae bacterium]|nr:transglutaminase domain-containing protein [Lachnospiraceae bacterium]